ncbi:DNA-binding transcriptional LysR family regulator [Mesorhizobium soli]|nr:DNA-binding transcriptional LysR family regulator [Mesorhizobium soli]
MTRQGGHWRRTLRSWPPPFCLRDRPSGTIRITTVEHAAKTILVPTLKRLLPDNPDINIEVTVDYGLVDVVADRFDAGIRLGGEIAKDMIAVRIGPDIPMAIVGSPDYSRRHAMPTSPARLIDHRAINLRLPMRGGRETRVSVDGPLAFNNIDLIREAALDGHGLAYLPLDQVQHHLDEGQLLRALNRFTPDLPGYHLYYPHRRHASTAFTLFVDAFRFRG